MAEGTPFSREKTQQLADIGDKIVRKSCSYRGATRQMQTCNLVSLEHLAGNANGNSRPFKAISESLVGILTHGVCPEYYGPGPAGSRSRGYPYQSTQPWEMVGALRNSVIDGNVPICTIATSSADSDIEAAPSGLIQRRNPDRAFSADSRLISDSGRAHCSINTDPSCIHRSRRRSMKLRKKPRRSRGKDRLRYRNAQERNR